MNMQENNSRSREVLGAYWRMGLQELGNAAYGPGTVATTPEMGAIGTKPQSMVAEGLRGEVEPQAPQPEAEPSQLQQHLEQMPEPQMAEPERDDRAIERD